MKKQKNANPRKPAAKTSHRKRAASAVGAKDVRERIRETTVGALRDGTVTAHGLGRLVHEVLDGAVEGVRAAVPASRSNVLRQVFDGLAEAIHTAASAGAGAARAARARADEIVERQAPAAGKKLREANEAFLTAVTTFAKKAKGEAGDELHELVAKARRAAPKVGASAREAIDATDGRIVELGGEAARASARVARSAVRSAAMAAGGLFDGIADSLVVSGKSGDGKAPKGKSKGPGRPGSAGGSKRKATRRRSTVKSR